MQSTNNSQCYFVQLQVDSFLDGELPEAAQQVFLGHVQSCQSCAQELQFARSLHDAILDLPLKDCPDSVFEPVHRMSQPSLVEAAWWSTVGSWLQSAPLSFRVGAPVFATVLVAIALNLSDGAGTVQPQVASEQVEQYSPEEIQQALRDLNLAIEYLNDVSQRTEVMIGEKFLLNPLQESINASFDRTRPLRPRRSETRPTIQNNPI